MLTSPTVASASSLNGQMSAGQTLTAPSTITSSDGRFVLAIQADGNLVIYWSNGVPLWASNPGGHSAAPYFLAMQGDGNLVIYKPAGGGALWASNTGGHSAPVTRTNQIQLCHSQFTATNWEVYKVCLTSVDSFNGSQVSGFVSSVSCYIDSPTGVGNVCTKVYSHGSYWVSSRGYWEDWLNWRVDYISPFPFLQSLDHTDCVYLRVDTPPNGQPSYQNFANTNLRTGTSC
jgi:hypothetical protein